MTHQNNYIGYALYPAAALLFLALFGSDIHDSYIVGAGYRTQHRLTRFHEALSFIRQNCGRYPTTNEGIPAIQKRLPNMPCSNMQIVTDVKWNFKNIEDNDGYGERFNYTSDGNHYFIKTSAGYFLTDSTPTFPNKNGQYWENPFGGLPYPTFQKRPAERVVVSFWILVTMLGGVFFFPINQFSKKLSTHRRGLAWFAFSLFIVFFAITTVTTLSFVLTQF